MSEPVPGGVPAYLAQRWRGYHTYTFGRTHFTVDRRYVDLKPVGRGAYGLVCSAQDLLTGRKVAIKRIGKAFADLVDAKRVLREIKLLRHLGSHENIVELVDVMTGPPDSPVFSSLYIVSQLYECDLERIVVSSQKLTEAHLQYFVYQLLRGLKYIHSANVLHRDLKPSNLLVNSKCDLAICDFGLARGVSEETVTEGKLTEYVVTRWYRAPELLCECKVYGPAVDVWSVGCIMGEILARRPILQGQSANQQLQLIIHLLGTPTDEELESVASEHAAKVIKSMGVRPKTDLAAVFLDTNELALDLLGKMLVFDWRKRITVQEALEHPYLAALHGKIEDPVCGSHFDFEFERGYPDAIPEDILQGHMYSVMCEMHDVVPPEEQPPGEPGEALVYGAAPTAEAAAAAAAAAAAGAAEAGAGSAAAEAEAAAAEAAAAEAAAAHAAAAAAGASAAGAEGADPAAAHAAAAQAAAAHAAAAQAAAAHAAAAEAAATHAAAAEAAAAEAAAAEAAVASSAGATEVGGGVAVVSDSGMGSRTPGRGLDGAISPSADFTME